MLFLLHHSLQSSLFGCFGTKESISLPHKQSLPWCLMYLNSETHLRYGSMRGEHVLTIQIEYYRKLKVVKVSQRWFLLVPAHAHHYIIMGASSKLPKMFRQKAQKQPLRWFYFLFYYMAVYVISTVQIIDVCAVTLAAIKSNWDNSSCKCFCRLKWSHC